MDACIIGKVNALDSRGDSLWISQWLVITVNVYVLYVIAHSFLCAHCSRRSIGQTVAQELRITDQLWRSKHYAGRVDASVSRHAQSG